MNKEIPQTIQKKIEAECEQVFNEFLGTIDETLFRRGAEYGYQLAEREKGVQWVKVNSADDLPKDKRCADGRPDLILVKYLAHGEERKHLYTPNQIYDLYRQLHITVIEWLDESHQQDKEDKLKELLEELEEYFENRADADYGDEKYEPNKEMVLLTTIRRLIADLSLK